MKIPPSTLRMRADYLLVSEAFDALEKELRILLEVLQTLEADIIQPSLF